MKKILFLLAVSISAAFMVSCSENDPVVFDDAFVYIADESGASSSVMDWESQNYLSTYYVYLVIPAQNTDITVNYDLIAGDGLKEGVDYKLISSTSSPLAFLAGIYKMPIRIEWLKHGLDPSKDNTMQIVLTSCSNTSVRLGKPGPDSIGKIYTIIKK
ncbi:MAG: hypothetical protein LKI59_09840 [Bacteroidales bacterium]|nr:hypothetical protein [Bacteroidales bacterium]